MPLADADASALQVTSTAWSTRRCSTARDGGYRPALAESWDVSDDGMRLAVRVRSGVRWHDHRAFGVLDVQGTLEPLLRKGNDAPRCAPTLADVASVELVTERTVRFVLKRPSDLALRALCDVPILPDHLMPRRPRRVGADRAPADRHRAVPVRRLGARQAHPPRALARILGRAGGRRRDRLRPRPRRRARAESHAARRDRRAVARARRALPGAGRADDAARRGDAATGWRRGATRSWSSTTAHFPLADPRFRRALAMLWDRDALRRRAAQRSGRARSAARRSAADVAGAAVRSAARDRAARGRRLPRQRRRRRARSRRTADPPDAARAGGQPLVPRRGARVRAGDAQGRHPASISCPADAATILPRLKHGEFDLAPMIWEGRPTRIRRRSSAPTARSTTAATDRARSTRCSTRRARAAGPAARAPILARIAQPADRRAAGDLPLPLRRPRAGLERASTAWPRSATASICAASGSDP